MRLVLDTNIVISALLWKGSPHDLFAVVRGRRDIALYSSPKLLAELADVLSRAKLARVVSSSTQSPETLMGRYVSLVGIVVPVSVPPVVAADPDDDHVLACALAAQADLIVSGDSHLLRLGEYQSIPIVTAAQALTRLPQR